MAEMVPTAGFKDHVTAVLAAPVTVAVNCVFCAAFSDALKGVSETLTPGASVIIALLLFEESATLVAVTTTVCALVIEPGAV